MGKGVISRIIPDDEMPRVNGEPCGIILNPYSIIGRKIEFCLAALRSA